MCRWYSILQDLRRLLTPLLASLILITACDRRFGAVERKLGLQTPNPGELLVWSNATMSTGFFGAKRIHPIGQLLLLIYCSA
jgi:hypothetical protein